MMSDMTTSNLKDTFKVDNEKMTIECPDCYRNKKVVEGEAKKECVKEHAKCQQPPRNGWIIKKGNQSMDCAFTSCCLWVKESLIQKQSQTRTCSSSFTKPK